MPSDATRRGALATAAGLIAAPVLLRAGPALGQGAATQGPATQGAATQGAATQGAATQGAATQGAAPAAAQQAPGFYRFKVGSFTVTTVHDGTSRAPLEGFVRNAPLAEVQRVLAESFLPTDSFTIPFTVTFVDTGRQLVAFDAGTGGQLAPTAGQMHANLQAAGIDPARVGVVAMSHFHGDHITGLTTRENQMVFPNAEIVVPEAEWAWWTEAANEARSPQAQRGTFANTARRFAPYQGRIRRIGDGAEVVPGIRAISAFGHTPGHTAFHVSDGEAQFIYVADATNRPELLARRPDFHIGFDFDPVMAEASRRRLYDRVAADRVRVSGYHYPFPANGYLAKEGDGYRYVPATWTGTV